MRILKAFFTALAAAVLMLGGLLALVMTVLTAAAIFLGRRLFRPTHDSSAPPTREYRRTPPAGVSDVIDVDATEIPMKSPAGDQAGNSSPLGVASDRA